MRLSTEQFAELVREALEDIPETLAGYLRDVTVDIEPLPSADACRAAGIRGRRVLLGLYRGTPLTRRSVEDSGRLPDRITLFQRNLERMCTGRDETIREIRRTVFHEVGHHFGMTEQELEDIGY